jgi:BppU N-terminal domain
MAFEYKEFPLSLDLVEGTSAQSSNKKISLSQRDIGVSKILFSLTFRNVAYPIPAGAKVRLFIKRYNSGIVMQDQTAETGAHVVVTDADNGKIEVLLNSDSIANAGQAEAQIEIELAPGKIMTSQKFSFFIEAALGANGGIVSGNDIPLLDKALAFGEKFANTDLDAVINVTSDVTALKQDQKFLALEMNVKYYGAIGDGNSHPLSEKYGTLAAAQNIYPHATSLNDEIDWCAAQKVHNNLSNKGGEVKFTAGVFKFNKPLSVTKIKTKVRGEGFNSIVQAVGTPSNLVNFGLIETNVSGSAKLIVEDMLFQIFQADATTAAAIKIINSITDVVIRECWFSQTNRAIYGDFVTLNFSNNIVELCKSGGVVAEGSNFRKVVISDNNFFANNGAHIRIKNTDATKRGMHNITITGNGLDQGLAAAFGNGFSSTGNGIEIEKIDLFTIEGNFFNGYTPVIGEFAEEKQKGHALKLTGCNNFSIGVNTYSKYNNSALYIDSCEKFNVKGGIAEGFGAEGIAALNSKDFSIDIDVNTSKLGALVRGCERFKINGHYFKNSEHGVSIESSKKGKFEGESIDNNTSGAANNYGVYVWGTSDRIRVLGADSHVTDPTAAGQFYNVVISSSTTNCRVENTNAFPFKTGAILNNSPTGIVGSGNVTN